MVWDKIVNKAKGELIDIIEYLDDTNDTLVHRFERYNNEIKNGAQMIVRQSQNAVFVREGEIADTMTPGRHVLDTNNVPVLSTLLGWKHGFESPFKAEVYFVNTKLYTGQKWGTQSPFTIMDPELNAPIPVRARGSYNFRIDDPAKFVANIAGTNSRFTIEGIQDQLRSLIVTEFTDAMGELNYPVMRIASQQKELGITIQNYLNDHFAELGLGIHQFLVENVSFPPEVEAKIKERAGMAILGNLDDYTKLKQAEAIGDMAKNQGEASSAMGAGMGMGMGMNMAQMMAGMGQNQQQQQPPQQQQAAPAAGPPPVPGQQPYFIAINGQQQGPFNQQQLQQMISSGQLTRDTLVWREGLSGWLKAGDQPDLSSLFGSAPPPLPPG